MKKLLLSLAACTLLFASCKDKDDDPTPSNPNTTTTDYTAATVTRTSASGDYAEPANNMLSGEITTNTVLKTGKTYLLQGFVYIKDGATLKIEPGATIQGDKSTKGTLVITRNGKIDARGTASQPIVFTSKEASPNVGDWGGIILLGNSRTNSSYNGTAGLQEIEGGVNTATGFGLHGGSDVNDNSGAMQYVRIEYPGIAFQPNNEINGLTFGSVGAGTTIDHIEVYKSGDDSYEWFGGTVNCNHMISYSATDDDFDSDNGFSGKVQFGISVRDLNFFDAASGGTSNGFESDNDANGTDGTPKTAAVFSNFTMIGVYAAADTNGLYVNKSHYGRGAHIRRNSAVSVFNSAFIGWANGTRLDGSKTMANATSGELEYQGNLVYGPKAIDTAGVTGGAFDAMSFFNANGNTYSATTTGAMLTSTAIGAGFNPMPLGGSSLLSGASFSSTKLSSGFTTTTYRGAVGAGDTWYLGWARF